MQSPNQKLEFSENSYICLEREELEVIEEIISSLEKYYKLISDKRTVYRQEVDFKHSKKITKFLKHLRKQEIIQIGKTSE